MSVKDYFSGQAAGYAQFRPGYPLALFEFLLRHCNTKNRMLDAATGNGQVALQLAPHFVQVDAIDISAQQLAHATPASNIKYQVARAESTPFEDHCFDLLTVGQAAHWFEPDPFYSECRRIVKPGGVLALFGYLLPTINPEVDQVVDYFYNTLLDGYWDSARKLIDAAYETLPFPFERFDGGVRFASVYDWNADSFADFLSTWSAVATYTRRNHSDPVALIKNKLSEAWGSGVKRQVTFPVFLVAGTL